MTLDKFLSEIEKEARKRVRPYPEMDEDFKKALESSFLKEMNIYEAAIIAEIQDKLCDKCGECCRRCTPITLLREDVRRIASYFGHSYKDMKKKLKLIPNNDGTFAMPAKPCPFLKGNLCSIYQIRPFVCRVYPAGYFITQMAEQKKVEINDYCRIVREMLIIKLIVMAFRFHIERENPELALAIKSFNEKLAEKVKNKPIKEAFAECMLFAKIMQYQPSIKEALYESEKGLI
jgi:Fe-S-cluster containining protein